MKMMTYIYFILLASLLMACEKDPIVDIPMPPKEEESAIEIEWISPREVGLETGATIQDQFIYEDILITFGDLNLPAIIYAWDKHTGELSWKYTYEGSDNGNIIDAKLFDNVLVCTTFDRTFGFDLNTQDILWELDLVELDWLRAPFVKSIDKIYFCVYGNWRETNQTKKIIEIDPISGDWRDIISFTTDSIGTKQLSPPIKDIRQNGREIIYFNLYPNADSPPQDGRQELVALDLNTREVIWKSSVTDVFASNSLHPPVIYEDLVITGGDWSIYAYDIHTGEQRWKTEISDDSPFAIFSKTNHLIHNDRLYVNENGHNVTCLDPMTGELIWNNPQGGPNCTDNMLYYEKEDLLVFTSWGFGSVMVLDALTGETIHREGPFEDSNFNNDVVYDRETDKFFTSTFKHAIGFTVERL